MSTNLALVRSLLERALFDLEHGWNAAAYDAIARAAQALRDGAQDADAVAVMGWSRPHAP